MGRPIGRPPVRGRQAVAAGQVWESTDPRDDGRQLTVVVVDGPGDDPGTPVVVRSRRHSTILVRSLWRRYRLVDGPGSDRSQS